MIGLYHIYLIHFIVVGSYFICILRYFVSCGICFVCFLIRFVKEDYVDVLIYLFMHRKCSIFCYVSLELFFVYLIRNFTFSGLRLRELALKHDI